MSALALVPTSVSSEARNKAGIVEPVDVLVHEGVKRPPLVGTQVAEANAGAVRGRAMHQEVVEEKPIVRKHARQPCGREARDPLSCELQPLPP